MPINAALEELLSTLTDAGDAQVLRGAIEKNPVLGEGWLRQADYDRNLNKVKEERLTERQQVEANNVKMAEWQKWYDEEAPKHGNVVAEFDKAKAKIAELEVRIQKAAEAGGDENVNIEAVRQEVESRLKNLPVPPTQAEITKIIGEETSKAAAAATKNFMDQTFPAVVGTTMDLVDLAFEHQTEFGEKFDRKKVGEYMKEHNISDPRKAHDEIVAPLREAKKIEAAKKLGADEAMKSFVPGTGAPVVSELGHMQSRQRTAEPEVPATATLHQAGQMAAAALRSAGKA